MKDKYNVAVKVNGHAGTEPTQGRVLQGFRKFEFADRDLEKLAHRNRLATTDVAIFHRGKMVIHEQK